MTELKTVQAIINDAIESDKLLTLAFELLDNFTYYYIDESAGEILPNIFELLEKGDNFVETFQTGYDHDYTAVWTTGSVYYSDFWTTGDTDTMNTQVAKQIVDMFENDFEQVNKVYNEI